VVPGESRAFPADGRESVRKGPGEVPGDFESHVHRRDDPAYRAQGRSIGPGPIGSACKTVIGKRIKGGGRRWGGDGADEMCHPRALFSGGEGRWDAYWHPAPN
jgi:hypothetical protein